MDFSGLGFIRVYLFCVESLVCLADWISIIGLGVCHPKFLVALSSLRIPGYVEGDERVPLVSFGASSSALL